MVKFTKLDFKNFFLILFLETEQNHGGKYGTGAKRPESK
jgi:hypothetical protein